MLQKNQDAKKGQVEATDEYGNDRISTFKERVQTLEWGNKCQFKDLHVSSGLDMGEHKAIQDCVNVDAEAATVTFKCAWGFSATGEPRGSLTVSAECKNVGEGQYEWFTRRAAPDKID